VSIAEDPLLLIEEDVGLHGLLEQLIILLDEGDVGIIEVEPAAGGVSDQGVVVTAADRALVDDHGVELVGVTPLDGACRAVKQRRWVHHMGSRLLVAMCFLLSQIGVEIALVERELEGNRNVVRKLLLSNGVKTLQVDS